MTEATATAQPTPEQDIIEGLFGEPAAPAQPAAPVDNKPVNNADNPDEKLDTEAIIKRAVAEAVTATQSLINQSANSLTRQQQLNTWFASEDGKMFATYKQFIEKAASDPRFSNLRIDQLPAAVLKTSAYAKVLTDAKEAADKAAKDGVTGGTGAGRPTNSEKQTEPDYGKMSRKEFNEVLEENKRKRAGR